ncbi:hypothetical protein M1615_03840 [Patescibacteria group bacterium]|nr:hypothetical protein [Patescibacteria group bacterium]MCL5010404.1 hypothetical protein [Patescibacteria group bacterium]
MQPQTDGEYQKLLTEVIKKQIVVLGPAITLARARSVNGLTVSDDGTVTVITGSPKEITQELIAQFIDLSGLIIKKTMEPLLTSYPSLAKEEIMKTVSPPGQQADVKTSAAQDAQQTSKPVPSARD